MTAPAPAAQDDAAPGFTPYRYGADHEDLDQRCGQTDVVAHRLFVCVREPGHRGATRDVGHGMVRMHADPTILEADHVTIP